MRYVIIGNSAAGVRAVETLRSLDSDGKIVLIDREEVPAYSRCLLPEFLSGDKTEEDIKIRPQNFYQKNRVKTVFGQEVRTINTEEKEVVLEGNVVVPFDKLLVATGAASAMPPIPGIDKDNIFGLRNLDDARHILEASKNTRRSVVIGGGFVGLEAAYALYKRGLEVTVVEMMSRILPQQFDQQAADILRRDMQSEGIRFILGQGVKEIVSPGLWKRLFGQSGTGVILEGGQQLKAELIIVAAGTKPSIDLAEDTDIGINRGILVNKQLETNVSDIYAAGDVAETIDLESGDMELTPIWPNASVQGKIAAYNMTGYNKNYDKVGMQNAVEFREVPAIAMGLSQPGNDEKNNYEILQESRPAQNYYKKLVLSDNVIVGMTLVGDIHQAGIYGAMIKKKIDVSSFRDKLLDDNFNYSHLYHRRNIV